MLKTEFEGEFILHRLLWKVVQEEAALIVQKKEGKEGGEFYPSMVGVIFAFHTVEAYLNYVGERLAPEIWKDERNYFRKEPYRGCEGKIRKVLELAGIAWKPEEVPLKTILSLKAARDLIAHGKPEKLQIETIHPDDTNAPPPVFSLRSIVLEKDLAVIMAEVELFLDEIHRLILRKSPAIKQNDPAFGDKAFAPWTWYLEHHTTEHH